MASLHDSSMADQEEIEIDNNFAAEGIQRYNDIMIRVEDEVTKGQSEEDDWGSEELFARLCFLSAEIHKEIIEIFMFIHDMYSTKLPDLKSSVSGPVDYCLAVKEIQEGNPAIDLLCARAASLDAGRKRLVEFVETRIGSIAPNLSAIVGISVAAKLVVDAGGLRALSRMPLVFYSRQISVFGFQTGRVGHLEDSDVYRQAPACLRERVEWMLGMASGSAAGWDYRKSNRDGTMGICLRNRILERIQRMRRWRKNGVISGSGKLGPKAAGKFKKQRNGGGASSGSGVIAEELADQFGEMALATQTTSPTLEFSKMKL